MSVCFSSLLNVYSVGLLIIKVFRSPHTVDLFPIKKCERHIWYKISLPFMSFVLDFWIQYLILHGSMCLLLMTRWWWTYVAVCLNSHSPFYTLIKENGLSSSTFTRSCPVVFHLDLCSPFHSYFCNLQDLHH